MESLPFDPRALPPAGILDRWQAPDGWPLRRFRLGGAAPARGSMLVLNGRGDMIEKYLEVIVHWAGGGWHVTSFDWRGQGGSGRLAADPVVGDFGDFGQWIADLGAFVAQWRKETPGPHVILGHSMGGHLLLRALVERVVTPDAAVLVAPMLALNGGAIGPTLGRIISGTLCALGFSRRAAWREAGNMPARQSRLTHSTERYLDEMWWRQHSPDVSLGAPSWRWLREAYRSTRMLERSPAIERMTVPTLVIGTDADRLVLPAAIRRVAARLPDAGLHMYGAEAAHEILRESDGVRNDALARIDAFLDARAPAR